ncbi:MAG: glycosyltransferase [Solirubrobacteraceae bacterium]
MSTVVEHQGTGLAALVSAAAQGDPDADVAVVRAGAPLPDGWLKRLEAAVGGAGEQIAAATAGTGSDNGRFRPNPNCTLIRAQAVQLLGGLDPDFTHPGAALADFAARARGLGLAFAVVPTLPVPGTPESDWPAADRALLAERHPWLDAAADEEAALDAGPLKRSVIAARAARDGISVTIDARSLGSGVGGTQTYVGALVLALARSQRVRVRALLADPDGSPETRDAFAAAGAEVVSYEAAASGSLPLTDIVHRPQQVFTPSDLRLLQLLGERIVITHMDLISYNAPTYHASFEEWQAYRRTTRLALAAADGVVFLSEHARDEALAEELLPADRAHVAGIGVAKRDRPDRGEQPARIPSDRPFLLMLGADYAHKNRPFAVALTRKLRARHGWDGLLVLAGSHVTHGASPVPEADDVLDLGRVSEAEKAWLMTHAVAHLAPSAYEGFGLAPLEAAAAGRPCIYAAVTSLREIIDPAAATLVPWDVAASAAGAATLLSDGPARVRHLGLLGAALDRHSWERAVTEIVAAYERTLVSPFRSAAPRAWAELEREQYIVGLDEALHGLDEALHDLSARVEDGLQLIDARDPMLTGAQRHGLMRVASRRWLRVPVLGFFSVLGTSHRDSDRPPPDGKRPDAAP